MVAGALAVLVRMWQVIDDRDNNVVEWNKIILDIFILQEIKLW